MPSLSHSVKNPVRVLMLDDSEADAELIRQELNRAGLATVSERVNCEHSFAAALENFAPDVVLSDHSLALFDAQSALALLLRVRPTTPLIIVTGSFNGDKAIAWLRAGVEDLIIKSNLSRLAASITDAVHLRRPLEKLTARQIEVLRMVAEGRRTRDRGVSQTERQDGRKPSRRDNEAARDSRRHEPGTLRSPCGTRCRESIE